MMAKKKDVIALKLYAEIMRQSENPPLHPGEVELAVFQAFDSWQEHITNELKVLISEWELEVPEDTSLYTLGLRRAVDIVNGEDPIVPPSLMPEE